MILRDVLKTGNAILTFTKVVTFKNYEQDELVRSGAEWQIEIVGEARVRLRDIDED